MPNLRYEALKPRKTHVEAKNTNEAMPIAMICDIIIESSKQPLHFTYIFGAVIYYPVRLAADRPNAGSQNRISFSNVFRKSTIRKIQMFCQNASQAW